MYRGNAKRRVVFGKTGSGKTWLTREEIERIIKETGCHRVVFYDSNGHDYSDGVVCDGLEEFKAYASRVIDGDFKMIFRSPTPRKDFATVCQLVLAAGNIIFVVDEMDMYFDKGEPGEEFIDVIRRGRHEDIELVGISQRPRQLGEVRSMADELFIFDTHEPSDLQYFKQSFSEALVNKIKQLKKYEYVKVLLPYDESTLTVQKENEKTTKDRTEIHSSAKSGVSLGLLQQDSENNSEAE